MKKITSLLLVFAMVLALFGGSVVAAPVAAVDEAALDEAALEEQLRQALFSADDRQYAEDAPEPEVYDPDEVVRVIVEMQAAPGYETMSVSGASPASAEAQALKGQEAAIATVRRNLGLEPVHRSGYLVNTVSYDICRSDIAKLEQVKGVLSVTEAVKYEPEMFSTKEMTGVYEAWKQENGGYTGKGIAIAIIDTGVNYAHHNMVMQDSSAVKFTEAEMEQQIAALGHGKYYSEKVPFGFSYITGRDEIINEVQPHGHHVAGIAAAWGDESQTVDLGDGVERHNIAGVAPDAQIFAMQVYDPYTGSGGFGDDIICAIEDAVKLGADVVNMSLGSDSGFYGTDRYIERAINAAKEAGVFVSVSAGNSGISSDNDLMDGVISNDLGMTDVALVSSPSTAVGATSVASVDAQGYLLYNLTLTAGGKEIPLHCVLASSRKFLTADNAILCDAGAGDYYDYAPFEPKEEGAAPRIAVVSMDGSVAPSDVLYYAYWTKMSALLICVPEGDSVADWVNSTAEYYDEPEMPPAAFVPHEELESLLAHCVAADNIDKAEPVSCNGYGSYNFASGNSPVNASFFTSWGPTQGLEIKPELAAPGGNVLSVGIGQSFLNMSGTSMAAPFIAGSAALVKESMATRGLQVEDVPEFLRMSMMNTAHHVVDTTHDGAIFSVRQLGAGLVDVGAAVKNNVIATYNGKAAIELGDNLAYYTTGTVTLTNYGDTAVTYTLNATDVYTDHTDKDGVYYDVRIDDAAVTFRAKTVTVPANGSTSFPFTLKLGSTPRQHYVEGYFTLTCTDEAVPSLSLPFLGFVGDWDAEVIVDQPEWKDDKMIPSVAMGFYGDVQFSTHLMTLDQDGLNSLGRVYGEKWNDYWQTTIGFASINPDYVAISPNGDNQADMAVPFLGLVRNAETVKYTIHNTDGDLIADVGQVNELRKITAPKINTSYKHGTYMISSGCYCAWDGTAYNPQTGKNEVLPEGDYIARIQSRARESGDWQTVDMPIAIDLTAPTFQSFHAEYGTDAKGKPVVKVQYSASDAHGVYDRIAYAINDYTYRLTNNRWNYDEETGIYSSEIEIPAEQRDAEELYFYLMISDLARNVTFKGTKIKSAGSITGPEQKAGLLNLSFDEPKSIEADSYRVFGYAPAGSTAYFNELTATFFDDEHFFIDLPTMETENIYNVKIVNAEGMTILEDTVTIRHEKGITDISLQVEDALATNFASFLMKEEGSEGDMARVHLYLPRAKDCKLYLYDEVDGSVTLTPELENDNSWVFDVPLHSHGEGRGAYAHVTYVLDTYVGMYQPAQFLIYTADCAKAENLPTTPNPNTSVVNAGIYTIVPATAIEDGWFTLRGQTYNPIYKVLVNGELATVDDASASLFWSCKVKLKPGRNQFLIESYIDIDGYRDVVGTTVSEVNIYYDNGPQLKLGLPAPFGTDEDGNPVYYTEQMDYLLNGTMISYLDDVALFVNNTMVDASMHSGHAYGQEMSARDFSQKLHFVPGDNYVDLVAITDSGMVDSIMLHFIAGPLQEAPFTDVPAKVWYSSAVDYAYWHGLMNGMGNNTFQPQTTMSRAMLVTTLWRAAGCPVEGENTFADVPDGKYYTDAVAWAAANEIVNGIGDNKFAPNANVTREQIVTILCRYAEKLGRDPAKRDDLAGFPDAGTVSNWAKEAMQWAVAEGLIIGSDGKLLPKGSASRAQVATILMRFLEMK